jgi:hypothetical protein
MATSNAGPPKTVEMAKTSVKIENRNFSWVESSEATWSPAGVVGRSPLLPRRLPAPILNSAHASDVRSGLAEAGEAGVDQG